MIRETLPWSLLLPLLAQSTEAGFRSEARSQMTKPGRTYAALGEAMGVDADDARKALRGVQRPTLLQALAAARYFATFHGEADA